MPTTISGSTGVSQVQNGVITAADLDGAQTGSAPIYGCRAWVNFDGTKDSTGATSTANTNRLILGSGNVSSVLRNGAGDYTVAFTTAMPDENYAVNCSRAVTTTVGNAAFGLNQTNPSKTTSGVRLLAIQGSTVAPSDNGQLNVAIFR